MDQVFFSIKRAHHAILKFARPVLAQFGLTPARFDVLHALIDSHVEAPLQRDLRRALGVARATISEMLTTMERVGLIQRSPCGRTRGVRVTAKARDAYRRVVDACMNTGDVAVLVDGILTNRDAETDSYKTRETVNWLTSNLRRDFGDTAVWELYTWNFDYVPDLVSFDDVDELGLGVIP